MNRGGCRVGGECDARGSLPPNHRFRAIFLEFLRVLTKVEQSPVP